GNYRASGVEDLLGGAVVALQLDHLGLREIARKIQQDRNVRAAPTVDGLIFVAHYAQMVFRSGQQPEQIILHAIRVLILIDKNVLEPGLPLLAYRRRFAQQLYRS